MTQITRTNIFGGYSTTASASIPTFFTNETTAAGKLIDKLKWIADAQIAQVNAATEWLGLAANAGQNESSQSIVKKELQPPSPITSSNVLSNWVNPAMPALPAFPTLPADLKIDMSTFRTALDAEVNRLRTSWLSQAIPTTPTDISRMDNFIKDVLNGTDETIIKAKLDLLESDLKTALSNVTGRALSDLNVALSTMRTNVAAAESGLQPRIDAALDVARDDTANIAWALARDQLVREATRQEAEAYEEFAARGFSMPGGALNAVSAAARQATLDAASRIAAEQAVRSQGQYLEIAKVSITSWMQIGDFKLKSEIAAFTSSAEQILKYGMMELDANRDKVKQAVEHLGLRIDFTKFAGGQATQYRLGVASAMNGLISAYANLTGTEMQYHARIADAQRNNLTALVEYFRAALSYSEMGFRASITNNEHTIRWADVAARFIGQAVQNHVMAAHQTADAYAKVAGLAVSGLNGVASVTSGS